MEGIDQQQSQGSICQQAPLLWYPNHGQINALIVLTQNDFFRHCLDYGDLDANGNPTNVSDNYDATCGAGDPRYESWTEDPETEWPAFELVDGDRVPSLPQWADDLIDPPGTGAAYRLGTLSHYYWQMSGGQMRLEGHVYPELYFAEPGLSPPELTRAIVAQINANPHGLDFSQFDRYINGTNTYGPDLDLDGEPDGDGVFDMLIIVDRWGGSFLGFGHDYTYDASYDPNDDHFDPNPIYLGGLRVKDNHRYGSGMFATAVTRSGMASIVGHEMGHAQIGCHDFGARLHIMSYRRPSRSMSAPERIMLDWVTPRVLDVNDFSRRQESLIPSIYSYEALQLTNGTPGRGDVIAEARTWSSWWDGPRPDSDGDFDDRNYLPDQGLFLYTSDSDGNQFDGLENLGGLDRDVSFREIDEAAFDQDDAFSPFSIFGFDFEQDLDLHRRVAITDIRRTGETFTFNVWGDYLRDDQHGEKTLLTNYGFDQSTTLGRQNMWHLGGHFRFESGMTLDRNNGFTFDGDALVTLGRLRQEPGNGNVSVVGVPGDSVRFGPTVPGRLWQGIELEADDALFEHVAVTGAKTGLTVLSQDGLIRSSRFAEGRTGIKADYAGECDQPDNGDPDPVACYAYRSFFDLQDTRIEDNGGIGLFARNADFEMRNTTVQDNGQHGVLLWNATSDKFFNNNVVRNGAANNGHGLGLTQNSDLALSQTGVIEVQGENRIANNARHEIGVIAESFMFIGNDEENGHNAIFDDAPSSGSKLIYYAAGASNQFLEAEYTFWGDPNGPPVGSFVGPVDPAPYLSYDPTDDGSSRPTAPIVARTASQEAWLKSEIRQARQTLDADPTADGAADLVSALYYFQRLDRDDEAGEYRATRAVLASLRGLLDRESLPAPLAATAARALQSEVSDALRHERYAEAEALLSTYGDRIADARAQRGLALSRVILDEQAGRYGEALAGMEKVIASLGDDEAEVATDLALVAAAIAEAVGIEAVEPSAATAEAAPPTASASLPQRFKLGAAYPNPVAGAATVPFALPEAADVRITVYDVLGRQVALLADERREAGRHAARFETTRFASGVYLVRATFEGGGSTRAFTHRLTVVR